jgi:hypothetical protein
MKYIRMSFCRKLLFNIFISILMLYPVLGMASEPTGLTATTQIEIRGIYGSPNGFWKQDINLSELGVNSIFMHHHSITEEIMNRAGQEGLTVYAEFPTLNGKNYVQEHPDAWPINAQGEKAEQATWFMGVCPTNPEFKQFRMMELRKLLNTHDVKGVWMDYVHWHAQFEDPEPILPETCFCEDCLIRFQAAAGVDIPYGTTSEKASWILENRDPEWRKWRASVIAGWARDMKMIINQEKPGTLLGIYHCPWDDEEFNGARRRILGLDYGMLRDIADVFSPMVYHGRMERSAEWVGENIRWFTEKIDAQIDSYPKIWTIVQAADKPREISAEEFEQVLRNGAVGNATGVMMFTSNSVAQIPEKIQVMKKVYSEWESAE